MNIAQLLIRTATQQPESCAWRFGSASSTYCEMSDRVADIAQGLQSAGMREGDRVALFLPNRPELIEMLFACWWSGLVAVPINWHLHPNEVAWILEDCKASAILVAQLTRESLRLPTSGSRALVIDVDAAAGTSTSIDALKPSGARWTRPDDLDPEHPAWIFYTSGTTGKPKGAVLSHRNLLGLALNFLADIDSVPPSSVFLHAAPLTHGSGLYVVPAVARAATNVISTSRSFDPTDYLSLLEGHRVTHGAFLSPTMLKRIVEAISADPTRDLSSVRLLIVGGGPIYEADIRVAVQALGPRIVQMYGQGEAPMTITKMTQFDLARVIDRGPATRVLSCGRPFVGVDVKIVDEDGNTMPPFQDGEVIVRGDVVMTGYWGNDAATATALHGGWLRTGDVGHFDDDGYLYLTDRAKDVIISGGSNVYPREVEEALMLHESVGEAAVIGTPDPEWGEAVLAFVVTIPGAQVTAEELINHCRGHIASFKKPKYVEFVDELPRNATGKILRRDLRNVPRTPVRAM